LTYLVEEMGAGSPVVQQILAGKSPRARATELVNGTKVNDVAFRKKLFEDGKSAVDSANDPMLALAKLIDEQARAVRKIIETQGEVKQQAHAKIAKARFALEGTSNYPDATFTLRLAFGAVKGYQESGQQFQLTLKLPAFTSARRNRITVRPSIFRKSGSTTNQARPEDRIQFRFHRGHHRRATPAARRLIATVSSSESFSTATFSRSSSISSTRTKCARRSPSIRAAFSSRCAKSIARTNSWRS
jgi:hypothetical protein